MSTEEKCPDCGDELLKAHGPGICGPEPLMGDMVGRPMNRDLFATLAGAARQARVAMHRDKVEHQIREWSEPGEGPTIRHRIVLNGYEGPWVGKAQLAVNGVYRGNSGYYAELPRLFVAIDMAPVVQEHRTEDHS